MSFIHNKEPDSSMAPPGTIGQIISSVKSGIFIPPGSVNSVRRYYLNTVETTNTGEVFQFTYFSTKKTNVGETVEVTNLPVGRPGNNLGTGIGPDDQMLRFIETFGTKQYGYNSDYWTLEEAEPLHDRRVELDETTPDAIDALIAQGRRSLSSAEDRTVADADVVVPSGESKGSDEVHKQEDEDEDDEDDPEYPSMNNILSGGDSWQMGSEPKLTRPFAEIVMDESGWEQTFNSPYSLMSLSITPKQRKKKYTEAVKFLKDLNLFRHGLNDYGAMPDGVQLVIHIGGYYLSNWKNSHDRANIRHPLPEHLANTKKIYLMIILPENKDDIPVIDIKGGLRQLYGNRLAEEDIKIYRSNFPTIYQKFGIVSTNQYKFWTNITDKRPKIGECVETHPLIIKNGDNPNYERRIHGEPSSVDVFLLRGRRFIGEIYKGASITATDRQFCDAVTNSIVQLMLINNGMTLTIFNDAVMDKTKVELMLRKAGEDAESDLMKHAAICQLAQKLTPLEAGVDDRTNAYIVEPVYDNDEFLSHYVDQVHLLDKNIASYPINIDWPEKLVAEEVVGSAVLGLDEDETGSAIPE